MEKESEEYKRLVKIIVSRRCLEDTNASGTLNGTDPSRSEILDCIKYSGRNNAGVFRPTPVRGGIYEDL